MGGMNEGGQKAPNSMYKISPGDVTYNTVL